MEATISLAQNVSVTSVCAGSTTTGVVATVSALMGMSSGDLLADLRDPVLQGSISGVVNSTAEFATAVLPYHRPLELRITSISADSRRRTTLSSANRQELATLLLGRITSALAVSSGLVGNESLSTTLDAGVYQLRFTYLVASAASVRGMFQFEASLQSEFLQVSYEGSVYMINSAPTATTATDTTVPDGSDTNSDSSNQAEAATAAAISIGIIFILLVILVAIVLLRQGRTQKNGPSVASEKEINSRRDKPQVWWEDQTEVDNGGFSSNTTQHYYPSADTEPKTSVDEESREGLQNTHYYPRSSPGWNPSIRVGGGKLPSAEPSSNMATNDTAYALPRSIGGTPMPSRNAPKMADNEEWSVWIPPQPKDLPMAPDVVDANDDMRIQNPNFRPLPTDSNPVFRRATNGYLDYTEPSIGQPESAPESPGRHGGTQSAKTDVVDDFDVVDGVLQGLLKTDNIGDADIDSSDDESNHVIGAVDDVHADSPVYGASAAFKGRHAYFSNSDDEW